MDPTRATNRSVRELVPFPQIVNISGLAIFMNTIVDDAAIDVPPTDYVLSPMGTTADVS